MVGGRGGPGADVAGLGSPCRFGDAASPAENLHTPPDFLSGTEAGLVNYVALVSGQVVKLFIRFIRGGALC